MTHTSRRAIRPAPDGLTRWQSLSKALPGNETSPRAPAIAKLSAREYGARPAEPTAKSIAWSVGALVAILYGIFFVAIELVRRKLGH
jgi:hypothetical protein